MTLAPIEADSDNREMNSDLRNIKQCLEPQPDLQLALVYGSLARAATVSNSDVDIAVMAEQPLAAKRRIALIAQLGLASGRPVDLLDLRNAGLPMLRTALTTGRVLFNKDPTAYGQLLSRFLLDSADFLPYRQRILDERRVAWIGGI